MRCIESPLHEIGSLYSLESLVTRMDPCLLDFLGSIFDSPHPLMTISGFDRMTKLVLIECEDFPGWEEGKKVAQCNNCAEKQQQGSGGLKRF